MAAAVGECHVLQRCLTEGDRVANQTHVSQVCVGADLSAQLLIAIRIRFLFLLHVSAPAAPTPLTDQFMSTAWPERVPWAQGASSRSLGTAITSNEASHLARFVCEVPGCGHRFPAARLLGLHIRMGHNDFDLENMQKAAEVMGPTVTLDGLPITPPIRVGGNVR